MPAQAVGCAGNFIADPITLTRLGLWNRLRRYATPPYLVANAAVILEHRR